MSAGNISFSAADDLQQAVALLSQSLPEPKALPENFTRVGLGEAQTLQLLAPHVLGGAARLGKPEALAHMDPPTPWITWAMQMWNASLNQNLLHPATSPFASEAEKRVMSWLTPFFGMDGGHMCSGSTVANLTALWAARDTVSVKRVVASQACHVSVPKAARILGLEFQSVATNEHGAIDVTLLDDLSDACLVLTAGTTNSGAIDSMDLVGRAAWTHVDAAWAGPLRLSDKYQHLLDGIDNADSVAVSAHKWLFQPKDSALVMFANSENANEAISFGGSYLTTPNVGVQGSRGAAAIPLLATLLAWGQEGLAQKIEHTMEISTRLAEFMESDHRVQLWSRPVTGVLLFRPVSGSADKLHQCLPDGMFSTTRLNGGIWLRSVAANPMADFDLICQHLNSALDTL